MARRTFVYDPESGKVIPKEEAVRRRAHSRGPSIIGDMAETRSMLDGKVYSSKKHYRDHVRAHGGYIVGNDFNNQPMTREAKDAPGLRQDIRKAMEGS